MGFRVFAVLGFRIWGFGVRTPRTLRLLRLSTGFYITPCGLQVNGIALGFRTWGLGFQVWGLGFVVSLARRPCWLPKNKGHFTVLLGDVLGDAYTYV